MKKAAAAAPLAPVLIELDAVLALNAAAALADRLSAARGGPLRLDASAVQRLGAQGLQVLLSAEQTWCADGAPFEIIAPSDRFLADWRLFGAPELPGSPSLALTETLS
jgi:chemotaxis protein CheX